MTVEQEAYYAYNCKKLITSRDAAKIATAIGMSASNMHNRLKRIEESKDKPTPPEPYFVFKGWAVGKCVELVEKRKR